MSDARPGLSGNQKRKMRSVARLYAVQALFQMEASGQSTTQVVREFLDHRFGAVYEGDEMAEGDVDLFSQLVDDAVNHQAAIDQMTDRALVAKWPIARIDPTLRGLFRAAGVPWEAAGPLVSAVVANAMSLGPDDALTGPIARGDAATVTSQREAIRRAVPDLEAPFTDMGRALADLAGASEAVRSALE